MRVHKKRVSKYTIQESGEDNSHYNFFFDLFFTWRCTRCDGFLFTSHSIYCKIEEKLEHGNMHLDINNSLGLNKHFENSKHTSIVFDEVEFPDAKSLNYSQTSTLTGFLNHAFDSSSTASF